MTCENCAKRQWQPIETAPRDGTNIDLWVKTKDCFECRLPNCFFCTETGAWYVKGDFGEYEPLDGGMPTHWMPLPAPPQAEEDGL